MPKPHSTAALPARLVAVDWSGRVDAAGQRRHIWAAVWTAAGTGKSAARRSAGSQRDQFRLESGRTRDELIPWLIELSRETPRMVAGFDCCFSFPAWFLAEHNCGSALEFWRHCAAGHAERWLARESTDERSWGKPHKRPAQFSGEHLHRMLRRTDVESKIIAEMTDPARMERVRGIAPKSPFQIGGSGSVGTGTLRAIPHLLALAEAGWGVWPFFSTRADTAQRTAQYPLAIEIYSRLMTGPVVKSSAEARIAYLQARRAANPLYRALPPTVVASARGSEDAFDALISMMNMLEHRDALARLEPTSDPIYRLEGQTWSPDPSAASQPI